MNEHRRKTQELRNNSESINQNKPGLFALFLIICIYATCIFNLIISIGNMLTFDQANYFIAL